MNAHTCITSAQVVGKIEPTCKPYANQAGCNSPDVDLSPTITYVHGNCKW